MLNIGELRAKIRVMSNRTKLYKALKEELNALGYWKNLARGRAIKGQFNRGSNERED